ncbi:hypothetical protein BIU88_12750 [Chlorobaculum limnaeum]|uniref:Peptidase S1 domain-containing protein n=1 Tax=Chlorobaculum limnaeum TaxID=274537 RepID=A0A1D8D2W6_CHLLM|nr:hypothetical protein [Chlorobaculum limnaeum]AOS84921.1 hypothetical protein BIU88_12750 [Chlorobaculum limnaeum]
MTDFMKTLSIALILLLPSLANGAMTIRNYSAARHYRFYTGSDKNFIGTLYDFSGVGYSSDGRWATLVSDNYFISAYHYHPELAKTVTFNATNKSGEIPYTYTVAGGTRIGTTDLWIGWFSTAVDSSIERYPVLTLSDNEDYNGLVLFNYGATNRVGKNVVESICSSYCGGSTGFVAEYDYDNNDAPSVGGDETYLITGDSGAPSFTVVNSSLSLLGIHWSHTHSTAVEGASSYDSFVPEYVDEINTVLAEKTQSLQLSVPVPEPNVIWYLMIIAGALILQRHRHALQ